MPPRDGVLYPRGTCTGPSRVADDQVSRLAFDAPSSWTLSDESDYDWSCRTFGSSGVHLAPSHQTGGLHGPPNCPASPPGFAQRPEIRAATDTFAPYLRDIDKSGTRFHINGLGGYRVDQTSGASVRFPSRGVTLLITADRALTTEIIATIHAA